MVPLEIKKRIELELALTPHFIGRHGLSKEHILNNLKDPYLKSFIDPGSDLIENAWVVFDEKNESDEEGYLVIFSEIDDEFGLATKSNLLNSKHGTLIGIYGAFLDAVLSM